MIIAVNTINPQLNIPQNRAHWEASLAAWAKIIKGATASMAAAGVGMPLKNPGMGYLSKVKYTNRAIPRTA